MAGRLHSGLSGPLPGSARWCNGAFQKGAVPFVAEPSLLKLVASKTPDPVKLDAEGKEISDPKRQCTPAKVRPVPEKLVYRKMPKDGSCVFHAMAAGIKFVTGGKLDLSARELRARAVGHLQKYADTCSKQYDKKGPDGSDMPEFEDYLTAIAAKSAYAGQWRLRHYAESTRSGLSLSWKMPPSLWKPITSRKRKKPWSYG